MKSPVEILLKLGAVGTGLGLWYWTQKLISQKGESRSGVFDRLHDWSAPLNSWLISNPSVADLMIIFTSILIDAVVLYMLCSAIIGRSLRPFIALLLLFALRQLCHTTNTLPTPPDIIWRYPGFPSLFVTYGTSNDFFFSGHTAVVALFLIESAYAGLHVLVILATCVAIIEAAIVIILRVHYTIDVLGAIFIAWGSDIAAQRIAPVVDGWLRHMT